MDKDNGHSNEIADDFLIKNSISYQYLIGLANDLLIHLGQFNRQIFFYFQIVIKSNRIMTLRVSFTTIYHLSPNQPGMVKVTEGM